jgi:hypothetical protein
MFLREFPRRLVQKINRFDLPAVVLRVRAPECISQKLANGLGALSRFFRLS